jgi:ADP-ribosylglycohydrolase
LKFWMVIAALSLSLTLSHSLSHSLTLLSHSLSLTHSHSLAHHAAAVVAAIASTYVFSICLPSQSPKVMWFINISRKSSEQHSKYR